MESDEAHQPFVIGQPTSGWLGSLFTTVFIGAIALFLLVLAALTLFNRNTLGFVPLAVAGFVGILFAYCLRDLRGKTGWRIAVGTDALDLELPRGRSLVHRLKPVRRHIRLDEIEALETRLEAYPGLLGLTNMHRSYAVKLKSGDAIILGEDRALHTLLESSILADAVGHIVRRSRLELRDLGMAEGRSGFLNVVFASPPPWGAPSLGAARQAALWAAAESTGKMASMAAFVTLISGRK